MNGENMAEVATKHFAGILLKVVGFLVLKLLILTKMFVSLETVKWNTLPFGNSSHILKILG